MNEKTLKDLLSSLKETGKPKTSAYDTTATVTRIENGVAWVHIPGGVRETPVKLTINAKVGDNVQVRVSGGRAFMVGNASAPPTDDHTARQALAETRTVSKVVKTVREIAEKASRIAGNTNQYFWHTESGTDTGAHITEIPQDEFLADPTHGGGNLLARSNGIAIRDGLTELSSFGAFGAQIGKTDTAHLLLTNAGTIGVSSDGTETFRIVVGGYSGTTKITESSGVIENKNADKSTMQQIGFSPQADPVDLTNITVDVTVVVSFGSYTKYVRWQFDRAYDLSRTGSYSRGTSSTPFHEYGSNITLSLTASWDINSKATRITARFNNNAASIDNATIKCVISVLNPVVPSYTFGLRDSTADEEGAYSFVGGTQNIASGEASTAFGVGNTVGGTGSASFGAQNSVTGNYGFASGQSNIVTGDYATALGAHLLAYTDHQTVIGHYNIADESDEYAFIVGNGDSSERKNVFTIAWSGETRLRGQYVYLYAWDNEEHQYRIFNQAYEDGLTYEDDGIRPHACTIYGGNGSSSYGIGAWDTIHSHYIWRYNDVSEYLQFHSNIRVGSKAIPLTDMCKSAGDTWSVNLDTSGYVTSSGTEYRFTVPIPYVSGTLSVTSMTEVYIRTATGGTVLSNAVVPVASVTVLNNDCCARVRFTITAPSGIVNNAPVGIHAVITFAVT